MKHKKNVAVNQEGSKKSLKDFVPKLTEVIKANKLFIFALILLLFSILYLVFGQAVPNNTQEKADYARQLHADANTNLNDYFTTLESIQLETSSTLNDDYYYSIKNDLEWLRSSEDSLYNSKPSTSVYPKELAYDAFEKVIIQINDSFSIESGEVDQTSKVNEALALEIKPIDFIQGDPAFDEVFTPSEKQVFIETVKYLTNQYVSDKKDLINQTTSLEQKYVEAKKLILLNGYE